MLTGGAVYLYNLPLTTLNGKPLNMSDLKGEIVFVNLWASWRLPYCAERPGIHVLGRKVDP